MNSLLGRQVDNSYVVRMYSIRGLGNMADIEGNQVRNIIYLQHIHILLLHVNMDIFVCVCWKIIIINNYLSASWL